MSSQLKQLEWKKETTSIGTKHSLEDPTPYSILGDGDTVLGAITLKPVAEFCTDVGSSVLESVRAVTCITETIWDKAQ
jgi:hypothetical protein